MEKGKINYKHDTASKRELTHYVVLVVGLVFFAVLGFFYRGDHATQLVVFFGASVFYVLWGLIHHYTEQRLTWAVAAEYVLFAFIAFLLVVLSLGAF